MKSTAELLELLNLETIEQNIFRGQNYQAPWKRVFGGQVLAQSIHAAHRSIPEDRVLHSMHAYFLLTGDISVPIIYEVDRSRDGGSFTTRRVVAIQKGKPIFITAASFQKRKDGFDHQIDIPDVPKPKDLKTNIELLKDLKHKDPELYKRYTLERPIEFRPVEVSNPLDPKKSEPFRHVWLKAKERLPDDLRVHQEILTYASDYNLLGTAILPHRENLAGKEMFFASLDHAMWFHRPFRADEWLLYQLDSPSASNARGFTRGNIFTEDGVLVASVVQEGLMDYRR
jgi:acyl-CoA thioesterase II